MKRIIDGLTYNTSTATAVARYDFTDDDGDNTVTVYQSPGGALFRVCVWPGQNAAGEMVEKAHFDTMTLGQLQGMLENNRQLEILDETILNPPPEAGSEPEPGATLLVRMPKSLKTRIEDAAKTANQSMNVFAMRCLEGCVVK